jgi:hypothetical protein
VFAFILDRQFNAVSIRAALLTALALSVVPTGTAQAELFWPHYRSWGWDDYGPVRPHHYRSWGWGDYEPFRQKRRRANKGYELEQKPKSQEVVKGPVQIIILHRRSKTLSLRRWRIDRTLLSINGSAGSSHPPRRIQRHW